MKWNSLCRQTYTARQPKKCWFWWEKKVSNEENHSLSIESTDQRKSLFRMNKSINHFFKSMSTSRTCIFAAWCCVLMASHFLNCMPWSWLIEIYGAMCPSWCVHVEHVNRLLFLFEQNEFTNESVAALIWSQWNKYEMRLRKRKKNTHRYFFL